MKTNDVTVSSPNFNATTLTVTAVSEAGRNLFGEMFGQGAVSAELPKSRGDDFARFCEQKGLHVGTN